MVRGGCGEQTVDEEELRQRPLDSVSPLVGWNQPRVSKYSFRQLKKIEYRMKPVPKMDQLIHKGGIGWRCWLKGLWRD